MFMLLLGASASVSLGQAGICDECDHIAPYFKGGGGFIGTVADGVEEVTFVTSCGSVSITGEADINDGTASQLFNGMNGFACDEDGGSLEIAGLEDGGWYWITDAMNSAVGPLVNKDVLENDMTMPVDPGSDDIVLTAGNGATFIRQLSTGRVGILPNILPEPPAPDAAVCGPRYSAATEAYTDEARNNCILGDGGMKIRLMGPGAHGTRVVITDGTVTRYAVGDVVVTADLWVNETGSISTADPPTPALGWAGKDSGGTNWLTAGWGAGLVTFSSPRPFGGSLTPDVAVVLTNNGQTAVGANPAGQGVITISPSSSYCPDTGTQYTATLIINAVSTAGGIPGVLPDIEPPAERNERGSVVETELKVVCPPRSANQGQGRLVPENLFSPTASE